MSSFVTGTNPSLGKTENFFKGPPRSPSYAWSEMTEATVSADSDYAAVTEGCGLVDRSEVGKLALTGQGAKEFLNGQITNDVEALAPGHGCYAAFLTPKGKMLGDLRVLDLDD